MLVFCKDTTKNLPTTFPPAVSDTNCLISKTNPVQRLNLLEIFKGGVSNVIAAAVSRELVGYRCLQASGESHRHVSFQCSVPFYCCTA